MSAITPYNFTELLGTAIETVIAAGQSIVPTASIVRNREAVTVGLPAIEIDIAATEQASSQMAHLDPEVWDYSAPYWEYNHFRSMANVTIASDRVAGEIDHDALVSEVHYLFSQRAQSFVSPVCTLFEILEIQHAGTAHNIAAEDREDRTELAFAMEYALLPAAFALSSVEAVQDLAYSVSAPGFDVTWTAPTVTGMTIEISYRASGDTWPETPSATALADTALNHFGQTLQPGTYNLRARYVDGSTDGPYAKTTFTAS